MASPRARTERGGGPCWSPVLCDWGRGVGGHVQVSSGLQRDQQSQGPGSQGAPGASHVGSHGSRPHRGHRRAAAKSLHLPGACLRGTLNSSPCTICSGTSATDVTGPERGRVLTSPPCSAILRHTAASVCHLLGPQPALPESPGGGDGDTDPL